MGGWGGRCVVMGLWISWSAVLRCVSGCYWMANKDNVRLQTRRHTGNTSKEPLISFRAVITQAPVSAQPSLLCTSNPRISAPEHSKHHPDSHPHPHLIHRKRSHSPTTKTLPRHQLRSPVPVENLPSCPRHSGSRMGPCMDSLCGERLRFMTARAGKKG